MVNHPPPELIVVRLTPEEANLFVEFQKQKRFLELLKAADVFNLKNGSVEIHFDAQGKVGKLDVHRVFRQNT